MKMSTLRSLIRLLVAKNAFINPAMDHVVFLITPIRVADQTTIHNTTNARSVRSII